jgi:Domain of unknown function (DUF4440)
MKRCPSCGKTFSDQNLSFCLDDGTPLVAEPADKTVVSGHGSDYSNAARDQDWNAVPYRPPGSYVPPGGEVKQRRTGLFIFGIVGVLIAALIGFLVVGAVVLPRLLRSRQNVNSVATKNDNTNQHASENSNNIRDDAANRDVDNGPPPTDQDEVLAQLTEIEHEWTVANLNADKKRLDRILADDYVGAGEGAQPQGKAQYIATIQRDTTVEKWDFDDLKLTLHGDRATLTGKVTFKRQDGDYVFDFTDKFVWRDGRWQATGSEVGLKK